MSQENPQSDHSLATSYKCFICKAIIPGKGEDFKRVSVTESTITYEDQEVCPDCKRAYDLGYKDGLDDSVG